MIIDLLIGAALGFVLGVLVCYFVLTFEPPRGLNI